MERPKKLSGEQGKYIEYLEKKSEDFSSKKTIVKSFFALKKTIDDINGLLIDGMIITNEETQEQTKVSVVSAEALSSKDEKTFERVFKIIDKIGFYNSELKAMAEQISPEDITKESFGSEYEEVQALLGD